MADLSLIDDDRPPVRRTSATLTKMTIPGIPTVQDSFANSRGLETTFSRRELPGSQDTALFAAKYLMPAMRVMAPHHSFFHLRIYAQHGNHNEFYVD